MIGRRGFLCGLGAIFGLGTPAVARLRRGPARLHSMTYDKSCPINAAVTQFAFSEKHDFDDAAITKEYRATLRGLIGRHNDAPFKGFGAGELLLTCVAYWDGGCKPSISFNFAAGMDLESRKPGDFSLLNIGA